jgi:hypothetical protein
MVIGPVALGLWQLNLLQPESRERERKAQGFNISFKGNLTSTHYFPKMAEAGTKSLTPRPLWDIQDPNYNT